MVATMHRETDGRRRLLDGPWPRRVVLGAPRFSVTYVHFLQGRQTTLKHLSSLVSNLFKKTEDSETKDETVNTLHLKRTTVVVHCMLLILADGILYVKE